MSDSVTIALRMETSIVTSLEVLARMEGLEVNAYVQRLVRLHVAHSGLMSLEE